MNVPLLHLKNMYYKQFEPDHICSINCAIALHMEELSLSRILYVFKSAITRPLAKSMNIYLVLLPCMGD